MWVALHNVLGSWAEQEQWVDYHNSSHSALWLLIQIDQLLHAPVSVLSPVYTFKLRPEWIFPSLSYTPWILKQKNNEYAIPPNDGKPNILLCPILFSFLLQQAMIYRVHQTELTASESSSSKMSPQGGVGQHTVHHNDSFWTSVDVFVIFFKMSSSYGNQTHD